MNLFINFYCIFRMDTMINNEVYINVTLLCKNAGKDINKWKENKTSKDFLIYQMNLI